VLLFFVFFAVLLGGLIYSYFEKWSFFNAVYFSVVTLTTIGYGDLYPVTFFGRLFTIFYVFIGIGLIFLFINKLASNAVKEYPAIKVIEKDKKFKEKIKKEKIKITKKGV
jgi:voltage-gated potassium channel Kch